MKKKKELKLKIRYNFIPELKPDEWKLADKLDKEIEKVAKKFGFKFEGSGFDFHTKIRDLTFYKPQ